MRIEFTAQIDKKEYVKLLLRKQMQKKGVVFVMGASVLILSLIIIYALLSGGEIGPAATFLSAYCVFTLIYFPLRYKRFFSKNFDSNKPLQLSLSYVISEDGVYIKGEGVEGTSSFAIYNKVVNNPEVIFLYVTDSSYNVFFKKWFTDEQLNEFIDFLRNKTSLKMEGF